MKKILRFIVETILLAMARFVLWFRYRITIKGLNKLNLKHPGGILFLPNHPAMGIDPLAVWQAIFKKFPPRPVVVEYMYYMPGLHSILRLFDSIPIPNNEVASNSLKRKHSDQAFEEVIAGLKRGENFLVYPAGKLKDTGFEAIGGASGAHRIISACPEANIVLVRTTGLWGSSFSKAYTGYSPPLIPMIFRGLKKSLLNLLFFNPRRPITIEFEAASDDFPRTGDRMEMNQWLEKWYNPGGVPEPLLRISYSLWKEDLLEVPYDLEKKEEVKVEEVPQDVQSKVIAKLAEMTHRDVKTIRPDMDISRDLLLDSLDMAEIVLFLEAEYDLKGVPVKELKTVGRVMEIASRKITVTLKEAPKADISGWRQALKKERLDVAPGVTLPEVFLRAAEGRGKRLILGDDLAGALSYSAVKIRAILIAEYIKTLPGQYIGIMLPASVAATVSILACQMAGKIPVMVNWTVGRRHLETVVEVTGLEKVLCSWAFLDRLGNVEIQPIEDKMILLEDVRRTFSIGKKLKAALLSKRSATSLTRRYQLDQLPKDHPAVVLFTSGSEAAPKGVPLSHDNILSNIRAVYQDVEIFSTDTLLAILPPFHSFGLTVGAFFGTTTGLRTAFYPNPTEGEALAAAVSKWQATIVCGAPTFLKNLLRGGDNEQLHTLRYVVTGAEKAPPELMRLMKEKGLEGRLAEGYGVTECSPVLTLNRPGQEAMGVGQPISGVDLLVINENTHEPLPIGQQGLILARGPNVFKGYLNKGLKSPFITVQGKEWYNTGDLGYLDEMNRLTISGRLKRFIKIGAEMVSLGAIEDALLADAHKKNRPLAEEGPSLAICAKENPGDKPYVTLFTVFPFTVDEANLVLREAGFSNLIRINDVKQIQEIPVMGSGKTHYRELETRYLS